MVSAIAKYNSTEISRKVVNDAMDVLGGSAISEGPRNVAARIYKASPIAITVEGANILTRSLIVFGQGAIRCHPYIKAEVDAVEQSHVYQENKLKKFFKTAYYADQSWQRSSYFMPKFFIILNSLDFASSLYSAADMVLYCTGKVFVIDLSDAGRKIC